MSGKIFQNAIKQMRDVAPEQEMGVVDQNGAIIACSDPDKTGIRSDFYAVDLNDCESDGVFVREGFTYKPFGGFPSPDYAVFIQGDGAVAHAQVMMMSAMLNLLKQQNDEKHDRNNFIKNIVLGNVMSADIGIKTRELHFNSEVERVVFLINVVTSADVSAFEVIQNLFPDKSKDFLFNITENELVLVKELRNHTDAKTDVKNLEKLAHSISSTLSTETFATTNIGIGSPVTGIKDLSRSFKEAQIAIDVGKVFETEKKIVCYTDLGIARLIYHLPITLCHTFLKEVFKKGSIESLDTETHGTIQRFFENNLNVSETSRKLFVHRNTLVYRLDKIKKLTGLDLREFEDAIVFKIALMVKKFLLNNDPKK
ncbi:MAG: helix-turn-helix domain-containing protein [Oscillospiraceae bacterium]|nr:helix-turn-helix domain-containing protein [Oscillospiraceae bacterium]